MVDPHWIRGPADELAIAQGCDFDAEAGQFVCDFIEQFCRQSKGRWAGEPIELLDWERDYLMRLFGWRLPSGLRRFLTSYLEIGKKNGKSTLVSALVIVFLVADGEGAPEVHLNACDREQASIVFDEAAKMVRADDDLSARLDIIDSKKRIVDPAGNGLIRANSADVPSKDGANPSHVIFDELHRQKSRAMWDVYKYASSARDQPLRISITTAGEDDQGVWYEQRERSEKINDGTIPDITHLGVVYRALETDDLDDPATWRKANPSLGVTIDLEKFRREWEEAKQNPIELANFKRLRLNIITAGSTAYLPAGVWEACPFSILPAYRRGQPRYMGLDLSSINDLCALATLDGDQEDGFDLTMRFWLPKENILALERQHGVPYRVWADKGYIVLTDGSTIDYQFIRREILELAGEGDLKKLLADPYNANQLLIQLAETDGLPVEMLRQGYLSLSAPTKELLRLITCGKLRHDANPVMRWMAGNAVVERDAAGNEKLSKKRSGKKIDGMAALVNAIAGASSNSDGGGSVYEDRGLLFL